MSFELSTAAPTTSGRGGTVHALSWGEAGERRRSALQSCFIRVAEVIFVSNVSLQAFSSNYFYDECFEMHKKVESMTKILLLDSTIFRILPHFLYLGIRI